MFYKLRMLWRGLKWLMNGAPINYYSGYHCGCCGKRWDEPQIIPTFMEDTMGETPWGLCLKGKGCNVDDCGGPEGPIGE